ncbi:hypothetical protein GCM10009730_59290 [Streptomyces albidochromogenes]
MWCHSRYVRRLADVPLAGRPLSIDLPVRRLYCENPSCPKATFAEQVPGLTVRYQRWTPLLQGLVEDVGVPATAAADPVPQQAVPVVPVQRPAPPEGYRLAVEAHRAAARPSRVDRGITQVVQRQTAAMRKLSRGAFPEPDVVPADAPAPIEQARVQRRLQAAATEAAVLRRARAERRTAPAPDVVPLQQQTPAGEVA